MQFPVFLSFSLVFWVWGFVFCFVVWFFLGGWGVLMFWGLVFLFVLVFLFCNSGVFKYIPIASCPVTGNCWVWLPFLHSQTSDICTNWYECNLYLYNFPHISVFQVYQHKAKCSMMLKTLTDGIVLFCGMLQFPWTRQKGVKNPFALTVRWAFKKISSPFCCFRAILHSCVILDVLF